MLDLATNRRYVFSSPVIVAVHAEGRGGEAAPQEALDWRRSG